MWTRIAAPINVGQIRQSPVGVIPGGVGLEFVRDNLHSSQTPHRSVESQCQATPRSQGVHAFLMQSFETPQKAIQISITAKSLRAKLLTRFCRVLKGIPTTTPLHRYGWSVPTCQRKHSVERATLQRTSSVFSKVGVTSRIVDV